MLGAGLAARAWWALFAAALAALALAGFAFVPVQQLQWQPGLALAEPWRAWTAAAVHYSAWHLEANLAGAALVGALGFVARVDRAALLGWFLAWPLAHFALALRPELVAYGGLSGVLHAGVAAAALFMIADGDRRQRWVGIAIAAALVAKIAGEAPWGDAVQRSAEGGIAVAPFAHAAGAAAGFACTLAARAWPGGRARSADTIGPDA